MPNFKAIGQRVLPSITILTKGRIKEETKQFFEGLYLKNANAIYLTFGVDIFHSKNIIKAVWSYIQYTCHIIAIAVKVLMVWCMPAS